MTPEKICEILKSQFGDAIVATAADASHPHCVVSSGRWREVAAFLRGDERMQFNMLRCITGVDMPADGKLAAVYDLVAMQPPGTVSSAGAVVTGSSDDARAKARGSLGMDYYVCPHEFAVRVAVDRDDPHIPSVAHVWPAADWHEREAYDLLGIVFDNHPDSVTDHDGLHPRRILCPDDWAGYPLRKDYLYPMEYHGIPGTTEYELTSPKH